MDELVQQYNELKGGFAIADTTVSLLSKQIIVDTLLVHSTSSIILCN